MTDSHYGTLPIGLHLDDYLVDSVVGRGAFGITYRATDVNLDMVVAIKEYLPSIFAVRDGTTTVRPRSSEDAATFEWGLDRFVNEAKTLARFDHPNLVRVLRFFRANCTAYMVMTYEPGSSLGHILKEDPNPLPGDALLDTFLIPLLGGLEQVHRATILHRDIKPSNIQLRKNKTPVLLDFGSAREAISSRSQALTSIFTPGYAPIEQYQPDGMQGPWTDLYSLAATAYRVIAGEAPPQAPQRVRDDPYVPATERGRGRYAPQLLRAIDVALKVDERARPQSVAAWRNMLTARDVAPQQMTVQTVDPDRTVTMTPSTGSGLAARRWAPARTPRVAASAVVVLLTAGGLALYRHSHLAPVKSDGRAAVADQAAEEAALTERTAREHRQAEERRKDEDARRQAEEARQAEQERRAEEEQRAQEERRAEAERRAEEARRVEEDRQRAEEAERTAATQRRAEEARRAKEKAERAEALKASLESAVRVNAKRAALRRALEAGERTRTQP